MKTAPSQIQDWFQANHDRAAGELRSLLETTVLPCIDGKKNDAPFHVLRDYTLALEDTFDQGVIDPAKWSTQLIWGAGLTINNEEQYYVDTQSPSNSYPSPFVHNAAGNLEIVVTPIQTNKPMTERGLPGGQNYLSGVIHTRDSLCFTEGYAEVCAKLPPNSAQGSWPATWLLNCFYYTNAFNKNQAENGGVGNDKFNPEIDFMEAVYGPGYQGANCIKNAYHYFTGDRNDPNNYSRWSIDANNFKQVDGYTGALQSQFNVFPDCANQNVFQMPDTCLTDYSQDFHTFAVDWTREYIHFYVDGVIVNCVNRQNIVSDQAMYLILNYAVGGSFPYGNTGQLADPNDFPASFEIEYARVYVK